MIVLNFGPLVFKLFLNFSRKKTIEGSIGMFLSMIFALLFLRPYSASSSLSLFSITIVSIVLTALEAFLANVDNIVLPLVGYALLSWFV